MLFNKYDYTMYKPPYFHPFCSFSPIFPKPYIYNIFIYNPLQFSILKKRDQKSFKIVKNRPEKGKYRSKSTKSALFFNVTD